MFIDTGAAIFNVIDTPQAQKVKSPKRQHSFNLCDERGQTF